MRVNKAGFGFKKMGPFLSLGNNARIWAIVATPKLVGVQKKGFGMLEG